jgi:hypothetical protein
LPTAGSILPSNTNNNFNNEKKVKKEKKENNNIDLSAFNYFNKKISKELPNVASIQNQLSLTAFSSIFSKYDWRDIMQKLEDLEVWDDTPNQKSLSKILSTFLYKDNGFNAGVD